MHWPNCLLQIATSNLETPSTIWTSLSALAPLFSVLTAVANLSLAIYVFSYTRKKNNADTNIKWFLELVYTPNKEAFTAYFTNLKTLNAMIPANGQWTEDLKIDVMNFVKAEAKKFQQDFVDILEIVAPATHKKVNEAVERITDLLVKAFDNDELKLENPKTYTREIGSPIMTAKGNIINALFEYKG
jgi:hypothetical protein